MLSQAMLNYAVRYELIPWRIRVLENAGVHVSSLHGPLYLHVSSYCYIRVLIMLYTCPHTAICVSSYCMSSYCYMRAAGAVRSRSVIEEERRRGEEERRRGGSSG